MQLNWLIPPTFSNLRGSGDRTGLDRVSLSVNPINFVMVCTRDPSFRNQFGRKSVKFNSTCCRASILVSETSFGNQEILSLKSDFVHGERLTPGPYLFSDSRAELIIKSSDKSASFPGSPYFHWFFIKKRSRDNILRIHLLALSRSAGINGGLSRVDGNRPKKAKVQWILR